MAHEIHLKNNKYRQWVKAGLGLGYLKEGLAPFCDDIGRQQHNDIINKIQQTKTPQPNVPCGACQITTLQTDHVRVSKGICPLNQDKCNCCFPNNKRPCPNNVCGAIYDSIIQYHASMPPVPFWKNSDVQQWSTQPWEVCKCFINAPGYKDKTSAVDTDCTGLLHVIINNKYFHSHIGCNVTGLNNLFSKMPGNCHFRDSWLEEDDFKSWLKPGQLTTTASCVVCNKTFDISSMGRTAVRSHLKGKKHQDLLIEKTSVKKTLHSYLDSSMPKSSTSLGPGCSTIPSIVKPPSSTSDYVTKDDVLKAEIWQCLKTVDSNQSFNSNNDSVFVFQQMFPDSNIAKKMQLAETKCMYLTCFGIAPYLSSLLENKIKDSAYVMLFDESLNRDLKKKQLDILVRHWDHDKVSTRYLTSDFLGHSCATDLLRSFELKVEGRLGFSKLVQLSMDGPNVNWCAFNKLQAKLQESTGKSLLDIGSCGLHTVHNAFRAAVTDTGWGITSKLSAMYTLFEDVPARREDYENVTQQNLYPLAVCAHRWVENIQVCQRAMQVLPYMSKFIDNVRNKKVKNPGTKSYETVVELCSDPFTLSKLAFIISVAEPVEEFLKKFQSDKPLVPFLYKELESLLRRIMNRFVKSETIASGKLTSVEFEKKENQKTAHRVELGFVADAELKKLIKEKKVSERAVLEYRSSCLLLLLRLTQKLMMKSPLCKSLVRNLACLDPQEMCSNSELCSDRFKRILKLLVSSNHVDINTCDEIHDQYDSFVQEVKCGIVKYCSVKDRLLLDSFYFGNMNNEKYSKVWLVVSVLLLLSHGQATIERGFSINKEVSEINLSENSLVARRVIKDYLNNVGGVRGVVITKELLQSSQHARQAYYRFLEEKRLKESQKVLSEKRKLVEDEVEILKKRKLQLQKDIITLNEAADNDLETAEKKQDLSLVAKANALRKKARQKDLESNEVKVELEQKLQLLKNM